MIYTSTKIFKHNGWTSTTWSLIPSFIQKYWLISEILTFIFFSKTLTLEPQNTMNALCLDFWISWLESWILEIEQNLNILKNVVFCADYKKSETNFEIFYNYMWKTQKPIFRVQNPPNYPFRLTDISGIQTLRINVGIHISFKFGLDWTVFTRAIMLTDINNYIYVFILYIKFIFIKF
jgi:hypothetical protein